MKYVGTKYALVIGNSQTPVTDLAVPFAGDSARVVADALTKNAGYDPGNVTVLNDVSSAKIMEAAKNLSDRVPDGGTVFIFFAGVATNVDGKDYFFGSDTSSGIDTGSMAAKSEVYRLFIAKGARVFAFYETNRPRTGEAVFGQEAVLVGAISQTYATIQGGRVLSSVFQGKSVGLFAQGMSNVMKQFHSNAVPIQDFAWEVFYSMRRGGQQGTGGGSLQTPTLPEITYMPAEARF